MNHVYRLCWNRSLARWVVASELARSVTRGGDTRRSSSVRRKALPLAGLSFSLAATFAAWAGPSGGQVTTGSGQITQSNNTTTIQQNSQSLSLNWQSFNVGAQETVNFVQPNASSLAVNRILSATGSEILGHLNANGQVWLLNPNGVLFGEHAQVNVGGLVASTLDLIDSGSADTRKFRGDGNGSVVNQGSITAASGGYVALMGHQVSNQGVISAQLGTVALGAGSAQTLTFSGNRLLHLQVDQGALNDLVENRKLIQANGGQVFMTAGAQNSVLASVVNNTGVVQAETVENHNGTITLLGGEGSTVNVGGTLDASAPHGGDGGSIETSGAHVNIDGAAKMDASAPAGHAGTWLVDPVDLTIDLPAATAINSTLNGGTNVTEQTTSSGYTGVGNTAAGVGDINVNAAITWTNAAASLTLDAYHGINVNAQVSGAGQVNMTANGGNLTLGSSVTGQAGVTLRTGANFVNNAGTTAVSAGSGAQWLVYSTNPTLDTTGGLAPGFIQYNGAGGLNAAATGSGFVYSVAPTLAITALTGPMSKTYDGTTTAALTGSNMTATGLIHGDTIVSGTGSYASANAANNIVVTSPTDIATLSITSGGSIPVYGYALSPATVTAATGTISPAQLSATIVGNPTKVYDGTTTATLSSSNYSLSGFVGLQNATVSQPSSVGYDSTEAGTPNVIAAFAATNFKADAGTNLANYVLPTSATGVGTITRAPVNLTGLLATDKPYDGGTTDSLDTVHAGIFGVIAPDVSNVGLDKSAGIGTFASANAGNGISVTPSNFQLTGTKAADYTLVVPTDLVASISRRALTITNIAATGKVYDALTSDQLDVSAPQLSGVVGSDLGHVTLVSGSAVGNFVSSDVGTNIGVVASGFSLTLAGSAVGNYTVDQPTGLKANITPAPLTITLSGNPTKPYNGTTTAVVPGSDFSITGFTSGQSAAITQNALAQYDSPNAGNNVGVTATLEASDFTTAGNTSLSNYSFARTVSGTGQINRIPLSGYITNNPTKTYDGNTSGTLVSGDYVLTGFVGSESATVIQPTGTYASANAGSEAISATVSSANFTAGSGTLLANYTLPSTLSGSGTILPVQLGGNYIYGSIVGNPTKTYDGTTVATLTPANFQLTGFVTGEGASVTQTVGQYANPNVGRQSVTAQLVSGDFVPQSGTNLGNYTLPASVYGTGTINPAALTATVILDPTKVYDGSTSTALASLNYHLSGFAAGEGATINPSSLINYGSKDVGLQNITAALTASAYTPDAGTLMSNYILATSATGTGHITQAPLYVVGVSAANKVYDATNAATLNIGGAGLAGLVTGESSVVTLNTTTSGVFAQADVANGIAVTTSGFSISGTGASNYSLRPLNGLRANITPAPLTISGVSANNRNYDATNVATLSTLGAGLVGVLNSDDVNLTTTGSSATFVSVNAGTAVPVTAIGFTLSGGKTADYMLSQPTNLKANIFQEPITATITGDPTKAYDGSNSATLTNSDYTLGGFVGGQGARVPQSATANYLTANAGSSRGLESTLVISDFVANAGTNLSNYSMPTTASGTLGTITPKILDLSGTRVYDTTTDAAGALFATLTGLNGDTLTVTGNGTLTSKNVGNEGFATLNSLALAANGAALASNYTLVGGVDVVKITPLTLTVANTVAASKPYDGNTSAVLSNATLTGVLGGDTVTLGNATAGNFVNKNVGTAKTVNTAMTLGGTDDGNYVLTQPSGITADIGQKTITVDATGVNRAYDGTVNDAAKLTSAGVVSGDTVVFADTSAIFGDANVANGKGIAVSGISASGADASNYILSNSTATTSADVTPKILNLIGTRVYDADTDALAGLFGAAGTLTGVNGETLTLSGGGTLTSKDVNPAGTAFSSTIGFNLAGIGGAQASNYTLVGGTDKVTITPATLTVSGTGATSKTYDGNTTAALTGATLTSVLGTDVVWLDNAATGNFIDKNIGVGKEVDTAMTITGTDAHNYLLTQPTGIVADIGSKTITVTASAAGRAYNGNATATVTLNSADVASGDLVTYSDSTALFASPNAAPGITINVSGIGISGQDAGNYTLGNLTTTTTADITQVILNLVGTRQYDHTTGAAATLFGTSGVLTGVNGETLNLTGAGALTGKDVNPAGTAFASLTGFTLTGNGPALAANYTFVGGTDKVTITKAPLTVTGTTTAGKPYDGNRTAALTGATLANLYSGDAVTLGNATTGTYANANAGPNKSITTAMTISGTDMGDYTLTQPTVTGTISQAVLNLSGTRVYDSSTNAAASLFGATGVLNGVNGEKLTLSGTGALTSKDVNSAQTFSSLAGFTLTGNGAALASNYTFSGGTDTVNITPAVLNLIGTRQYDHTTAADGTLFGTGGQLTGLGGETLTLSGSGTLTGKDVNPAGTSFSSLTGFTLTGNAGALASDYTFVGGTDKVTITKAPLTVTGTSTAGKPYDGNTTAALTGATLANLYSGDAVTLGGAATGTYANANAGPNKSITTAMTISGADMGDYTLTQPTVTGTISQAVLNLSGTRVYDGSTDAAAALFGSGGQLTGVNGETLTLGGSGTLASKDVNPAGTAFTATTGFTVTGNASALGSNYTLVGGTDNVTITPVVLNLTGTRVYDANTDAAASLFGTNGLLMGVNGETLTLSGSGTLTAKDVNPAGTSFASLTGFALTGNGGAQAGNYTFLGGTDKVTVTPAVLNLSGTRVYDDNTDAAAGLFGASGQLTGIGGETLTLAGTGTLTSKNVNPAQSFASLAGFSLTGNSGTLANDYTLIGGIDSVNITPAVLNLVSTRQYNGATDAAATLFGAGGQLTGVGGETLTLAGSGTLTGKDVNPAGTAFASLSGFTLTGNSGSQASNYTFAGGTDKVTITTAPLVIVGTTAADKVYDGNAIATLTGATLAGLFGSDAVTLGNDATGTFANANAAGGKPVNTAMTISGTDSGNYSLTQPSGITATIAQVVLNLSGTRVYDGNTDAAATLFGTAGQLTGVNGETLTLAGSGTLTSKDVSPARAFYSFTGFTLTGNGSAQAGNYTFVGGTDSVNITPAPLTIANTYAADKVYDGGTSAVLGGATLSGVFGGDTVLLGNDTSGTFADKNVGSGKTVTTAMTVSGTDSADYTLAQPSVISASITAKPITVAAAGTDKTYDGNVNDLVTLGSSGIVSGDAITFSNTATAFADKNVGSGKTVSVSGITASGADAGNYSYNASATGLANITPRPITVTATGADKVYDANTGDAGATLASTGILPGDSVAFAAATAAFADKNVGNGKAVAIAGISANGSDATNYTYNTGATTTANITPATLAVVGTVATNRTYDGTVTDALDGATLAGVLGSDTVLLGNDFLGTFADKNVGSSKTVASAMTISGTDAGNYTLLQPRDIAADITSKTITVAAAGTNKVYDGNTSDKVALHGSGMIAGDTVDFTSAAANFGSATVGDAKTVTVSGIQAVGSDAGNYRLASNTVTTTADITTSAGVQDTAVAIGYLELSPTAIATPYGVAPAESPGELTANRKMLHRPVERNRTRQDFRSGISLQVVDGGVRMPADDR